MSLLKALGLPPPPRLRGNEAPAASSDVANAASNAAGAAAASTAGGQAAQAWQQACTQAAERVAALKQAVKARCADSGPALVQEVDKGLARFDAMLAKLEGGLGAALAAVDSAADDKARQAAQKKARTAIAQRVAFVQSEPLIGHADQNPFDAKPGLKALLGGGLKQVATALG